MRPILGVLLLSATVVAASVRAQDNSSTVVRFKNSTLEQTEKNPESPAPDWSVLT